MMAGRYLGFDEGPGSKGEYASREGGRELPCVILSQNLLSIASVTVDWSQPSHKLSASPGFKRREFHSTWWWPSLVAQLVKNLPAMWEA